MDDLIDRILDMEWEMFSRVKSSNQACCQSMPDKFKKIRGALYRVWSTASLQSYLDDLDTARVERRNLLVEKYARMDRLLHPLPESVIIDEIVAIEAGWQEEIRSKYPNLYKMVGRDTSPGNDGRSFSVYLKSELETYSNKTVALYHENLKRALNDKRNLATESLDILVKCEGYLHVDHAESYFAGCSEE